MDDFDRLFRDVTREIDHLGRLLASWRQAERREEALAVLKTLERELA